MDSAMVLDMESARAAFVLCFFGAIGSAAVGREGENLPHDVDLPSIDRRTRLSHAREERTIYFYTSAGGRTKY